MESQNFLRSLYPSIEPYKSGHLAVSSLHTIYWEESGNPHGQPILFLHGGPGSGSEPKNRRFFDPEHYRIVLMDQRGCGRSLPHAELRENTTWDLVEDIEKVRKELAIDRWIVFGGSWGSTLALAYAETHPGRVLGLIVRGIFLCRKKELTWFYQSGAPMLFPDAAEPYFQLIPEEERGDMIAAYYRRLTSENADVRRQAARAWSGWEAATIRMQFDPALIAQFTEPFHAEAISRIECHYFMNGTFFETDNWLIENVGAIAKIPGIIIHGRYDVVCPLESAWQLARAWPEATFEIVEMAAHAGSDPRIQDALVRATDAFRSL